ncbi:DUF4192 domain-containing protein [Dactylosporangium sp. AC04546]|uniref:DUF4192 domain-containing protein n=1 Tax=Dactylosporangium sp. AC04546 TaxID=2862460 RepID=UPI001EDFE0B7|nr:DUF4192 domain-containing protein [Dactylosporangium sp. AC04546]WVK78916.1 DUF4192 domain-containing protein [Dactylosporangium sp. AC04546]
MTGPQTNRERPDGLSPELPVVAVTTANDLAAVIPYLLGFHPDDSIVVLVAGDDHRIVHIIRADLPEPDEIGDLTDALQAAFGTVLADRPTGSDASPAGNGDHLHRPPGSTVVHLLGYGSPRRVRPTLAALRTSLATAGLDLSWPLRITDGRVWADDDPTGPHGEPIGDHPEAGAVAAYQGVAPLPSKAAYIAQVEPGPAAFSAATTAAFEQAEQRLYRLAATSIEPNSPADRNRQLIRVALRTTGTTLLDQALRQAEHGQPLDDDNAALLTLMLHAPELRDVAMLHPTNPAVQQWAWLDLTQRARPGDVGGVGGLLAIVAWRRGDELLARAAAARVLAVEPTNNLANLVLELMARHVPPTVWSEVLAARAASNDEAPDR